VGVLIVSTAVLRKKNRVTIPIEIIKLTGLKENDPLKIDLVDEQGSYRIVIEPLVKRKRNRRKSGLTLEGLYENFTVDKSAAHTVEWGDRVGEEEW
jgi:bifunctional DNA-binding transcriptional regulator/antitoxin component of YhaV-PrlF toxin-antitoxin module